MITERSGLQSIDPAHNFALENLKVIDRAIGYLEKEVELNHQDKEDLQQEGYFGLLRAASFYNPEKGGYVPRYTLLKVLRAMGMYLPQLQEYSITYSDLEKYRTYQKVLRREKQKIAGELNHENILTRTIVWLSKSSKSDENYPTDEEIKEYYCQLYIPHKFRADCKKRKKMEKIISVFEKVISLNDENNPEIKHLRAPEKTSNPEHFSDLTLCREAIEQALSEYLTERERKVIKMMYGLEDGQERTGPEIAEILGVTSSRVYRILATALRRLRHPLRAFLLLEFYQG